jgi:cytosine/adenosine deaminase-related metal-dependent hydrolase
VDRALVPEEDEDVPGFWRALGLPGLADVHVHFLPPRLLRRVWQYFDEAGPLVGVSWPIRYKWSDAARVAHLRSMGVRMFSALAYAHRPGMAADLNEWTLEFGRATPGCLPSATFYPEPGVTGYVRAALAAYARQLAGLAGLELGKDWLRAVCWDNPVAMFGLPEAVGGG